MFYSTDAVSTLYVKLVLKTRPHSKEKLNYALLGDVHKKVTTKSPYSRLLDLNVEDKQIPMHAEAMRKLYNFARVQFVAE